MGITRTLRVTGAAALAGALLLASPSPAQADEVRDGQWALRSLHAESMWKVTKGEGQIVALIGEEGVYADHADLKGNVLKGQHFGATDSVTTPDKGVHLGTGIAGVIAGHGHGPGNRQGVMGLAPEAKILPVKEKGDRADGYAQSIRWAVDHGADVIHISGMWERTLQRSGEDEAVAYALQRNVVIVAGTSDGESDRITYPANQPGVVATTAIRQNGTTWSEATRGRETMLSAPGVQIVAPASAAGKYTRGDSTLYGAAYVAAGAALLKAKYPDLTAGQIVNRMTKTSAKLVSGGGGEGRDAQYGYGAIRPFAALKEDVPKGSEYGPLALPDQLQNEIDEAVQDKHSQDMQEEADRKFYVIWSVIIVVALLFVGGVVTAILIARSRRRDRLNGPMIPGA
jgi:hypothetical protein